MWLDGAMARLVVGSRGASACQCALVRAPFHQANSSEAEAEAEDVSSGRGKCFGVYNGG